MLLWHSHNETTYPSTNSNYWKFVGWDFCDECAFHIKILDELELFYKFLESHFPNANFSWNWKIEQKIRATRVYFPNDGPPWPSSIFGIENNS